MRSTLSSCSLVLAAIAAGVVLVSPRPALAYDTLAIPCGDDPLYCETGHIAFERVDKLPIEWQFDTGWVPQGSPIQVHIFAAIYANTRVALDGELVTSWPEALTLATPGDVNGGELSLHYGAVFDADGKIQVNVAGKNFSWQGDLPYLPQFDFQIQGQERFDAWAFAPGVTLSKKSIPEKLASIGISDIIGGQIPGIDGGFELDVAMEVSATYVTDRLVIATKDGVDVSGGFITTQDGQSSTPYLGGPAIELDVHPEGTVEYDGIVHMIPAFYVKILGQNFSIPVADIPIAFPLTKTDWVFDAQRVRVPLPDLVLPKTIIDFGDVEVGQKLLLPYSVWNAGEAKVLAAISSTNPSVFPPWDVELDVDPGITLDSAIRFVPDHVGEIKAQILLASNDPSDPVQILEVRGRGVTGFAITAPAADEDDDAAIVGEDSGCGCRTAGGEAGTGFGALAVVGMVAAGAARRRRSRNR